MKKTPNGFLIPKIKLDEVDEKARSIFEKWIDHLIMDTRAGAEIANQLSECPIEDRKRALIALLESGDVAIEINKDLTQYRWLVRDGDEYRPFR